MQVRLPADYGLRTCTAAGLAGGDAQHNARALEAVLTGQDRGPHRDCLLLGAALALEVAGRVRTPLEGVELASNAIDSGRARGLLDAIVAFSKRIAPTAGRAANAGAALSAVSRSP